MSGRLIVANWKMNGSKEFTRTFCNSLTNSEAVAGNL